MVLAKPTYNGCQLQKMLAVLVAALVEEKIRVT
jgi:hypothetical protein